MTRQAQALYFDAPYAVRVAAQPLPQPGPDEVRVRALVSAISSGTELLFYRGQVPDGMAADATLQSLAGQGYPLRYGYALVGEVETLGAAVEARWRGRQVFAFEPHGSHFIATPGDLQPLPAGLAPETATLFPSAETAVSLVMDGRPVIGERVVVIGLGVVGQLTTRLLADFPLDRLVGVDRLAPRRTFAAATTGVAALAPDAEVIRDALDVTASADGADLVFELSGSPAALDLALAVVGHHGRIVVGSWYGTRRAAVDLGSRFHRSQVTIQSSQVSHLAARWLGRWTKTRRRDAAWATLQRLQPIELFSHRFALADAAAAYELLDQRPAEALQVLFVYQT